MNPAALVNNPDGSTSVLLAEQVGVGGSIITTNDKLLEDAGSAKFQGKKANPFAEQDAIAMKELERMKHQDNHAFKTHSPADEGLIQILHQDAHTDHETYDTYRPPALHEDHALQAAIHANDFPIQSSIAATAAGANPILPVDPDLIATPGIDWLERMKEQDAALQKAVAHNDRSLVNP